MLVRPNDNDRQSMYLPRPLVLIIHAINDLQPDIQGWGLPRRRVWVVTKCRKTQIWVRSNEKRRNVNDHLSIYLLRPLVRLLHGYIATKWTWNIDGSISMSDKLVRQDDVVENRRRVMEELTWVWWCNHRFHTFYDPSCGRIPSGKQHKTALAVIMPTKCRKIPLEIIIVTKVSK